MTDLGPACNVVIVFMSPLRSFLALPAVAVIAVLLSFTASAQPSGDVAPTVTANSNEGELQDTDQTVKVRGSANDGDIRDRLTDIFDASNRYETLNIQVRDGIVFLTGTTSDNDYKTWAGDLARRTQDVVAVVNNLEVVEPPVLEQYAFVDSLLDMWRSLVRSLPLVLVGLLILGVSFVIALFAGRLVAFPLASLTESNLLRNVIRKLLGLMIVLGGLVIFLEISGLTGVALTVLSGTGLFGLILGFAFRDIAENFLASILLSVQTPFRLGDVIEVTGYTGVVQKVTPRGTVLIDFDGNHIQISNATVYKSTLKNLTANPAVRLQFDIGIGYDASVKGAQDVAMKLLRDHSAVLDDPEPLVLVDTLGASTINLKIYFWINGHEHSELKMKSAMMRRVLRSLEQSGISLPDEAREIIFPHGVPLSGAGVTPTSPGDQTPVEGRCTDPSVVTADLADEVTDAEGDLASEVDDIREQARRSRDPEAGPDIVP